MSLRAGYARRLARTEGERGSAVAEFALVGALLVLLFLALFQLGLALFVRNTLIASAADGARYGARADSQPRDGAQRARSLIGSALSDRFAHNVTADREDEDGTAVVVVHVRAPMPIVGPFGLGQSYSITAHAYAEKQ